MAHRILPGSETWLALKSHLKERKDELVERIVALDCDEVETIMIRAALNEIDRILDLETGQFVGSPTIN